MKILSSQEFEAKVAEEGKVVLIDFFADWCGPCRMLAPILEQASASLTPNQEICKLNIDESQDIARKYGVMSIPTMIVFKNGKEVNRIVGLRQKSQILDAINIVS